MKIYIIRHGETDANKFGILQGCADIPLNSYGEELAAASGRGLKGVHFDAAFSSPLIRAKKTAELVLSESGNDCPIIIDERIKEICAGAYEGKHLRPEFGEIPAEDVRLFFNEPLKLKSFPNGENVIDVANRTQEFLHELAEKDYETVLVSTHGCALRCMLNCVYDDPLDFWHGHFPYNCVVNIVEAKDGKFTLIADDKVFYDECLCVDRYAKL